MRCRVCDNELEALECVRDCRWQQFTFKEEAFKDSTKDVVLYKCNQCLHIQSEYLLPNDFYESYSKWEGSLQYTASMNTVDEKLEKLRRYSNGDNFIEIGCGVGTFLKAAEKYFSNCLGVEPSNTYIYAKKNGLNVINDYFGESLKLTDKYSVFASCQVFEHLSDLYSVMNYAYLILEDNGVGLINVPNGQEILEKSLYHQITAEHINYFTPSSLFTLARKVGFDILEIENDELSIELNLYIRKAKKYSSLNEIKEKHKRQMKELIAEATRITIWGAGAKSSIYEQLLDDSMPIEHLIDNNEEKVGLYVNGILKPVELVSREIIQGSDLIIIFASSYNNEIFSELTHKYDYHGNVLYFSKGQLELCSL